MKGLVSEIKIHSPRDLKGTLEFLGIENTPNAKWKIMAGATDIAVEFNGGRLTSKHLLDIWGLRKKLAGIKVSKSAVTIGALTTFTEIQQHGQIRKLFPSLAAAASLVGGVQIQNRGTIGGNIANASPAADSLPPLIAYGATLRIENHRGTRTVPLERFYRGYKALDLSPNELITEIILPVPAKGMISYFRKVGTRQAQAISKVVGAGSLRIKNKKLDQVLFCLGSVGPYPLRCRRVEQFLTGLTLAEAQDALPQAERFLMNDISPRDDIRSTRGYREFASIGLLREFLKGAQA